MPQTLRCDRKLSEVSTGSLHSQWEVRWPMVGCQVANDGKVSWLKHLAGSRGEEGRGSSVAPVCSFSSFSTFEWVQTSLALRSHLSVLFSPPFSTSASSLPPSQCPQGNWWRGRRGNGARLCVSRIHCLLLLSA